MRWAKSHIPMTPGQGATHYLAGSGMAAPAAEQLPLAPHAADLVHAGYDMPPEARRRLAERYGLADENRLMLTLGTSHAFHLLCASTLSPTDRCLVERPAYEMLVNLPGLFGASVSRFERRFEDGWRLPMSLPERIRRERPAMVLVSNPHNPSGVMLDRRDLAPVAEAVADVQGLLAVDEVYLEYTDDPVGRSALGLGADVGGDHVAVASSFATPGSALTRCTTKFFDAFLESTCSADDLPRVRFCSASVSCFSSAGAAAAAATGSSAMRFLREPVSAVPHFSSSAPSSVASSP